jgi:hypothetical protein
MLNSEVQIVTRSENLEMAGDIGLSVGTSLETAVHEALQKHGENARIAFVPYGRYTILDV